VYAPATGKAKPVEEEVITEENVFERPDETMGFFPGQVLRDGYVSTFILIACVVLSYAAPAPLTEPANTATVTYVPRPEWFFFFLDQWLIYFPGAALIAFGDVIVPALFVIVLLAIPWLDKEPAHSPARRPFVVVVAFLVVLVVVLNLFLAMSRIANFPGGTPSG
jgi:menaquinol-cytochrome c reductase cytochrome b/c subunit